VPTAAVVSFRLGGADGVSIEAAKWADALGILGWQVFSVAGSGPVDIELPGLAIDATEPPTEDELAAALAPADLVLIENLCSLPLNPAAAALTARVCAGRPAVLHHHDLPWQRPNLAHFPPPPDDTAWAHVTINELSRRQLAERGIAATTMYNSFDPDPAPGNRDGSRTTLGIGEGTRLLLQPTRALPRKNIGGALRLAESIGATYWLLGPAEDGYGPALEELLAAATCPVLHTADADGQGAGVAIADAYAACDAVVLASTWEGFGNPAVESATYRRPLAIGPYPVAEELAAFGFRWFASDDAAGLADWLDHPDPSLLEHNRDVVARHLNRADLPRRLQAVLDQLPTTAP
jgi:glycosyltransferase involved in cell wall biosynthesis